MISCDHFITYAGIRDLGTAACLSRDMKAEVTRSSRWSELVKEVYPSAAHVLQGDFNTPTNAAGWLKKLVLADRQHLQGSIPEVDIQICWEISVRGSVVFVGALSLKEVITTEIDDDGTSLHINTKNKLHTIPAVDNSFDPSSNDDVTCMFRLIDRRTAHVVSIQPRNFGDPADEDERSEDERTSRVAFVLALESGDEDEDSEDVFSDMVMGPSVFITARFHEEERLVRCSDCKFTLNSVDEELTTGSIRKAFRASLW